MKIMTITVDVGVYQSLLRERRLWQEIDIHIHSICSV